MVEKNETERFSLKGWKPGKFLKGFFKVITDNWGTIKEVLKWAVVPGALGSFGIITNPAVLGGIAVIAKALLDIGEYFIKK